MKIEMDPDIVASVDQVIDSLHVGDRNAYLVNALMLGVALLQREIQNGTLDAALTQDRLFVVLHKYGIGPTG